MSGIGIAERENQAVGRLVAREIGRVEKIVGSSQVDSPHVMFAVNSPNYAQLPLARSADERTEKILVWGSTVRPGWDVRGSKSAVSVELNDNIWPGATHRRW